MSKNRLSDFTFQWNLLKVISTQSLFYQGVDWGKKSHKPQIYYFLHTFQNPSINLGFTKFLFTWVQVCGGS